MTPPRTITVHVSPGASFDAALLRQIEALFPVTFAMQTDRATGSVAEIRIGDCKSGVANSEPLPVLELPSSVVPGAQLQVLAVRFETTPEIPFPFRGRKLRVAIDQPPRVLSLSAGERVLGAGDSGLVWTVAEVAGQKRFRSAFALPVLPADGSLRDVLNGERFVEFLPLFDFLRRVLQNDLYQTPPLRAGFIFDDPNLHWPSYGYVNYSEVARRAEALNYHVSFATIPLDAWFTHGRTAQVFRDNPERLSLCVHGNDHIKHELARDYTAEERVQLLRQAIRRIEGLERRAGVSVCRVMVPPHGACKDSMLAEIPQCGFESACISHGSLQAHNKTRPWTSSLGYRPAELVEGCAVLPRWAFSGNSENVILLAAYLGQPMILRGHHQDLKGGIELLDQHAAMINALGDVTWSNMTELSRANYLSRLDGTTLHVRPLSPKVTIRLPESVTSLVLDNLPQTKWREWQLETGRNARTGESIPLGHQPKEAKLTVTAVEPDVTSKSVNGVFRTKPWPFLRRIITEGRDRLLQ